MWLPDALRGLALLNMLAYHAMYDWVYVFAHASSWYDIWSPGCHLWQSIWFGVLHLNAAAVLLTCLVRPLLQRIPAKAGLAASAALFALTNQLPQGFIGFEGLRLCALPAGLYRANLFWLGLPDLTRFSSADYFPLLPWVFLPVDV